MSKQCCDLDQNVRDRHEPYIHPSTYQFEQFLKWHNSMEVVLKCFKLLFCHPVQLISQKILHSVILTVCAERHAHGPIVGTVTIPQNNTVSSAWHFRCSDANFSHRDRSSVLGNFMWDSWSMVTQVGFSSSFFCLPMPIITPSSWAKAVMWWGGLHTQITNYVSGDSPKPYRARRKVVPGPSSWRLCTRLTTSTLKTIYVKRPNNGHWTDCFRKHLWKVIRTMS